MKSRISFVSNSSSSSFIVGKWDEIPDEKKEKVFYYFDNVLEVWREKGLPLNFERNCWHLDFDKIPESDRKEILSEYDFGWLEKDGWRMKEFPDHHLELVTTVDNFDMGKWLGFLGIPYQQAEDRLGLFSDEEIDFSVPPDLIMEKNRSSNDSADENPPESDDYLDLFLKEIERVRSIERPWKFFVDDPDYSVEIKDLDRKLDAVVSEFRKVFDTGLLSVRQYVGPNEDGINIETPFGDWRCSLDILLNNEGKYGIPCDFIVVNMKDDRGYERRIVIGEGNPGGIFEYASFLSALKMVYGVCELPIPGYARKNEDAE